MIENQGETADWVPYVAYCGLYCGDCFAHQGRIADFARDLRKELRAVRFEKTAATLSDISFFSYFKSYPQCYEVLGGLVKLRCKSGCRDGGGNPSCRIRKCARKKGFTGCWECGDFESCAKLDDLQASHGSAHRNNLRRLKKLGIPGFIANKREWYSAR